MNKQCALKKNVQLNNSGFSLIELIVVIAIMGIIVGVSSMSLALAFSKDAERCATRLNDAIYDARMSSMSKSGNYHLIVNDDAGVYSAVVGDDKLVYLDGDSNSKKTNISAYIVYEDGGITKKDELPFPVEIHINKAKGNVIVGEASVQKEGIVLFEISQIRNTTKTSKVQLITSTGKHTIGDF